MYTSKIDISKNSYFHDKFKDYESLQRHFVSIRVNYPDLKYTYISQKPKVGIDDLVSNIGGIFGLFLGISFLTFAEFFIFILEILNILIKN